MAAVCAYADVYFAEQFKHTGRAVRACRRPISVHAGALESVTLHTREQNCTHLLSVPLQFHATVFMYIPAM